MDNIEQPAKRRGGRPSQGKRGTFSFRVTDTLREKLEADAKASGRPVSEVIEHRLERSYERESQDPFVSGFLSTAKWAINYVLLQAGPWEHGSIKARYAAEILGLEMANSMGVKPIDEIMDKGEKQNAIDCVNMAHEVFAGEIATRKRLNAGLFDRLLATVNEGRETSDAGDRDRAADVPAEKAPLAKRAKKP